jgi:geranylgeranyl diphosphate synthase, type II
LVNKTTQMLDDMARFKARVDALILDEILPKSSAIPEVDLLYRMMRDYPERPGKGMRPYLCATSCRAFGSNEDDALLTAACIELFQNWILIHDDIEDGSQMRRGGPALHRKYDWTLALNAGDALHARMWSALILNSKKLGEGKTLGIMEEFARMIDETTEGQHIELGWVVGKRWDITEADYFTMCTKKTSWYTVISPLRLGGIIAGAGEAPMGVLIDAGTKLGVGFQIHDDVLNLSADAKYGKEAADDLLEGKRTLILIRLLGLCAPEERNAVVEIFSKGREERREHVPRLLKLMERYRAIEYAQGKAEDLVNEAVSALSKVRWSDGGEGFARLEEVARFAVERDW